MSVKMWRRIEDTKKKRRDDFDALFRAGRSHLHLWIARIFQSTSVGEQYRDIWLVRFLVAFHSVAAAADKFKNTMEFRSNFGMDRIRECFADGLLKIEQIPGYQCHFRACPDTFLLASGLSKVGEPISITSLAAWEFERYLTHIPQDVEDMFQYYQQEYISMILDQNSKETGYLCGRIEVINLQGVAWGIRDKYQERSMCLLEECHRISLSQADGAIPGASLGPSLGHL